MLYLINTSAEYKNRIKQTDRKFFVSAAVTFPDEKSVTLTNSDFMEGGVVLDDGTSSPGSFEIGCACIGQLTLILNNYTEKFDFRQFYDATIKLSIGLQLSDHVEWIPRGAYTVNSSTIEGRTIKIIAYDFMDKFDQPYSESGLIYPASLGTILRDCCSRRGIVLQTVSFPNDNYIVDKRPEDDSLTDREIISYIAQLAGCYARMNNQGALTLEWYEWERFYKEDTLFGGTFKDWDSADQANGNTDSFFGGLFKEPYFPPYEIVNPSSLSVATDDIFITGIKIIIDDDNIYYRGWDGYIVTIQDNPLAQNNLEEVTLTLAKKFINFRFRPFSVTAYSDPSIEAGDVMWVTDRKGNIYRGIISNLSFSIDQLEEYSSDAETPAENRSSRTTSGAKLEWTAKKVVDKKISDYDLQVQQLNNLMANALGFYQTSKIQEDGSRIDYMHDKPTLEESQIIWKKTIDGFAISNDGGKTYQYGVTKDGNAILKVLSVIGVNADWIKAGRLEGLANPRVYFDLNNGRLAANRLTSSDDGATDVEAYIGLVRWNDGSKTKGFAISQGNNEFVRISSLENYDPIGVVIGSRGRLIIRSNAHEDSDDNHIQMYNDSNNKGYFEVWTATGNNSDELSIRVYPEYIQLRKQYTSSDQTYIDLRRGKIEFTTGQYARASIENNASYFGDIYSNGTMVTSDRSKKTNISQCTVNALEEVEKLKFYNYNLKVPDESFHMATITGYDDDFKHRAMPPMKASDRRIDVGIMYDEAPTAIQDNRENAIDLYSYISLTAKAVQELNQKVDGLKKAIEQMKEG